eukprot:3671193-Rhodomonas_salina.1
MRAGLETCLRDEGGRVPHRRKRRSDIAHPRSEHKKPRFQCNLNLSHWQECGFLYLISQCKLQCPGQTSHFSLRDKVWQNWTDACGAAGFTWHSGSPRLEQASSCAEDHLALLIGRARYAYSSLAIIAESMNSEVLYRHDTVPSRRRLHRDPSSLPRPARHQLGPYYRRSP